MSLRQTAAAVDARRRPYSGFAESSVPDAVPRPRLHSTAVGAAGVPGTEGAR
ncbi:hypothetical protein ACFWBN_09110 [Streptomyces sp. NPDC059989]|uniref:hypothetical protein n=1 Tax=Streptomyces sp. NPDC059989 TaxID=3347026 RepID=UPI0036CEBF06